MADVDTWVRQATAAAGEGRWQDAERAWARVLAINPAHTQALYATGIHAFRQGRSHEALQALDAARAAAPGDPVIPFSAARIHQQLGDQQAEMRALELALAADPYFLHALLAKGELLERTGQRKAAIQFYRNALKIAPSESAWPESLRPRLTHAAARVEVFGNALAAFLAGRVGDRQPSLTPMEAQRWHEAGAILSGRSRPYHAVCNQLHVPRLPAIPFFERAQFHWVEALEAATPLISAELDAVLKHDGNAFKPYVAYAPGTPVNQWEELNHSLRWSTYAFWENGRSLPEHLAKCPATAGALAQVGLAEIDGMCPNAMFSALAPRTRIPPHTGDTNARLVVHLPLRVPERCLYRVGFEQRRWKVGEALIFDDSIEHEAANDSDELRVVLIFDVWNPLLSEGEREMVRALTAATREFQFDQ